MSSFASLWQNLPLHVDPVALQLGPFAVRWYSLGYLFAFTTVYLLTLHRVKTNPAFRDLSRKWVEDSLFWAVLGIILGGRLGYVLFYNLGYYLENPIEIIVPFSFEGGFHFTGIAGMSFHGGVIGCVVALWLFARTRKIDFIRWIELYGPAIPLGYTWGRLGNFMNGELYGRATESPLGMRFYDWKEKAGALVKVPHEFLRHPSQLYEAFGEGLLCGALLWILKDRVKPGALFGLYFISYGTVRFFIEFLRQPDAQFVSDDSPLGTVLLGLSMGQLLCLGMIAFGAVAWIRIRRRTLAA